MRAERENEAARRIREAKSGTSGSHRVESQQSTSDEGEERRAERRRGENGDEEAEPHCGKGIAHCAAPSVAGGLYSVSVSGLISFSK